MTYSSTQVTPPPESAEPVEEPTEAPTATLPAGLFGTVKKGDVVSLRIVNVFDGEIEVAPVEESRSTEGITADEELDKMAQA